MSLQGYNLTLQVFLSAGDHLNVTRPMQRHPPTTVLSNEKGKVWGAHHVPRETDVCLRLLGQVLSNSNRHTGGPMAISAGDREPWRGRKGLCLPVHTDP